MLRVLEASIAENKASLKRTHTEVWSDSPNPHDRKRIENCPVGLKNVGNTCWFSAVIQVGAQTHTLSLMVQDRERHCLKFEKITNIKLNPFL